MSRDNWQIYGEQLLDAWLTASEPSYWPVNPHSAQIRMCTEILVRHRNEWVVHMRSMEERGGYTPSLKISTKFFQMAMMDATQEINAYKAKVAAR